MSLLGDTYSPSHPEEDFEWQWCSYTIVVHIWAASLSGGTWQGGFSEVFIHWRPCWLHWVDSMKIITAASNRFRLLLFLKYEGSNIIKEIAGHDLGLLFSWFDPCNLCVPELDCSWSGWLCAENNVKWHFSAKAEIIAISVIVVSCIYVPAYPQNSANVWKSKSEGFRNESRGETIGRNIHNSAGEYHS